MRNGLEISCVRGLPAFVIATWVLASNIALAAEPGRAIEKRADALSAKGQRLFEEHRYEDAAATFAAECTLREGVASDAQRLKLADCLGNRGFALWRLKDDDRALQSFQSCLALRERLLPPNDLGIAHAIKNIAAIHERKGRFSLAAPLYERVIAIQRVALGDDHLDISLTSSYLAGTYAQQARYEDSMDWYQRALSIRQLHLPPKDPQIYDVVLEMAELERARGRHDEAERMLEETLAVYEKAWGPAHLFTAHGREQLASLYHAQGSFEKAEALYEHVLHVYERVHGPEHFEVAMVLGALGSLRHQRGDHERARLLYERSLAINERMLGAEHPSVAWDLENLALLHYDLRHYDQAEAAYQRALVIYRSALGTDHPATAAAELNLARLYFAQGKYERAEAYCARALAIHEAMLGARHPDVATSLGELAVIRSALGHHASAVELMGRALSIEERHLNQNLAVAEDSRRIAYAAQIFASTHRVVSLHHQAAAEDHVTAELALTTVLRRKGRAQELVARSRAALRKSLPEEHQHLLDDLSHAQAAYAALTHRGTDRLSAEQLTARLSELEAQQDRIWAALAAHGPEVELEVRAEPVTLVDVQAALGEDDALVELIHYLPQFDEAGVLAPEPGPPRYAAYIVLANHTDWVDLGPAAKIDAQIADLRQAILHGRERQRDLYDTLMAPVLDRVGSARRLFIAPDGELHRVPFGALYDGEAYLVERYALLYLAAGRDVLRPWRGSAAPSDTVVVIANPTGADLPGTEREAEVLDALFPTRMLLGDEATETRVRREARPRALHFGTHGFHDGVRGGRPERELGAMVAERMRTGVRGHERPVVGRVVNPMLHSGLLLAEPDPQRAEDIDDGRLTAYEVGGWDLQGTELVVLSACGTGLGTVQMGEGVMGLRRAFATAGAQTQVTSLWDLGDETTPEVMERYYGKLARGLGRSDAMQQVQLELLRGEGSHEPRDWAAFVVVGEWGPLSGVPLVEGLEEMPPEIERVRGCQASVGGSGTWAGGGWGVLGLVGLLSWGGGRRRRAREQ